MPRRREPLKLEPVPDPGHGPELGRRGRSWRPRLYSCLMLWRRLPRLGLRGPVTQASADTSGSGVGRFGNAWAGTSVSGILGGTVHGRGCFTRDVKGCIRGIGEHLHHR